MQSTRHRLQNTSYKDIQLTQGRIDELSENFNKAIETIKKEIEMKNTH